MNLSEIAIRQPVTVAVGVILIVLTGVVALQRIPVQLTPNVEDTIIAVTTRWEGASPQEVEREVIDRQEEKLQGLTNLREMTSTSQQGQGVVRLEFNVGTDKDVALREVSDKLREVPTYPDNVDEPVVEASDPENRDYIAWIVFSCTDPSIDVRTFQTFVEDRVEPVLERVAGISEVNVLGGREREVQIRFDPSLLAERGITLAEAVSAIRRTNRNVSAGRLRDGKRNVRIRTVSQFTEVSEVESTVLAYRAGGPVHVRDVGHVVETYKEATAFVRSRGEPVIAINAQKEIGANVMEVMDGLAAAVHRLNQPGGPLTVETRRRGIEGELELRQVYDQTIYIDDALALVQSNIWIGGALAIFVLVIFLRSLISAGIIALAIPISVMGSIVAMVALGRNVNVISLAGMAFAVGMVVDNAIVVLENIYRHLEMGKKPMTAARDGALEVWGAVLAATLTTVVVFIPILLIEDEAGQLFRDIALAICAAVLLSLLVSVTVIPATTARLLRTKKLDGERKVRWWDRLFAPFAWVPDRTARLVYWLSGSVVLRVIAVGILTAVSLIGTYLLIPPTDYLPNGNRNLIFGLMIPPSGYSLEQQNELALRVEDTVRPFFEAGIHEPGTVEYESAKSELPSIPTFDFATMSPGAPVTPPPLENYFIVSFEGLMFHGGIAWEPERIADLGPLFSHATRSEVVPGVFGFAFQVPLFRLGGSTGSAVKINFSGPDLEEVTRATTAFFLDLMGRYGPGTVQPDPSNFNVPGPELQVVPDRIRLADVGLTPEDLGLAVQTRGDGAIVGEYRLEGDNIDLKMITEESVDQGLIGPLGDLPLATPNRNIVLLESVADLRPVATPQQIKHVGRQRAVTLEFTAPEGLALEEAVSVIDAMIEERRASGVIPPTVETSYTGSASKLAAVQQAMLGDGTFLGSLDSSMVQALLVVYLLMCVLFQSFIRPLVILLSVPLATFGGFAALRLVYLHSVSDPYLPIQKLDVLTMLGFLILIGVVVNNAILIVHQALNFMRGNADEGGDPLPPREAIREAVRTRVRPIFMSMLTSVGGMAPLVFAPGSGSELYRGLGSVVIGGLIVSTIFTLLLVPLLFSLVTDAQLAFGRRFGFKTGLESVGRVAALFGLGVILFAAVGCQGREVPESREWLDETVQDTLAEEGVNEPWRFEGSDPDGGFDPSLRERREQLEALAGPESYRAAPTLGTDLTGSVPSVVEVNLDGAVLHALANHLPLEAARLRMAAAAQEWVIADAAFDATLFGAFDFEKLDEPRPVPVLNGVVLGTDVNALERESIEAGVRMRSSEWGGTATVSAYLERFEDNIPGGFALRPDASYHARVGLDVRQPLLRGFGRDATRAQLRLSRTEEERARDEYRESIARLVWEVEGAFWDLVLAHRTLSVQERLAERGRAVRTVLEARTSRDANGAQYAEALAVVARRSSDLVRARALVQRASDRLKFWMNDADLPLESEVVLKPVVELRVEPIEFRLGRAIETALAQRPEVHLAIHAIEDARIRQALAESLIAPQLDLTAGIAYRGLDDRWYRAIEELDPDDFVSYTAGLVFELPFGNRAAEAEATRARLARSRSLADARQVVRDVVLEVKNALREVKQTVELGEATRAARIAQAESLRALEAEKETRSALTPEFLNLEFARQERLAIAEIEELVALVSHQKSLTEYRRSVGASVTRKLQGESTEDGSQPDAPDSGP